MTLLVGDRPFTPLAEALPRLEAALSPLVGIATGAVSTTYTTDESSLPNCACELASSRRTLGAPTVVFGSGAHPDPRRARAAAIGEAVERYSGVFVPFERLRRTTARALGDAAVHPSRFALFHPSQFGIQRFPLVPFTDDTQTTFVEGVDLADGSTAFLPAELVYLRRPASRLAPIGYATSSGLACGPSLAEAILGALLEVVERDAVMLAWKCRLSLPLLDWSEDDGADGARQTLLRAHRRSLPSGRCELLPRRSDRDLRAARSGGLRRGALGRRGLGCARRGSVAEGDRRELRCLPVASAAGSHRRAAADRPRRHRVVRRPHALLRIRGARGARRLPRRLGGTTPDERRSRPARGRRRARRSTRSCRGSAGRGLSAYAVDVTSPDVRDLGLSVARVIAPELCALDVSHRARFLGGSRLLTAAHEIGLARSPLDVADLNPLPHPFP